MAGIDSQYRVYGCPCNKRDHAHWRSTMVACRGSANGCEMLICNPEKNSCKMSCPGKGEFCSTYCRNLAKRMAIKKAGGSEQQMNQARKEFLAGLHAARKFGRNSGTSVAGSLAKALANMQGPLKSITSRTEETA